MLSDTWIPASYRHLQPALKRLIRSIGFRPGIKECFGNCQRILLAAQDDADLRDRVTYHEGWVDCGGFPIQHAWLALDGMVQDPTLDSKMPEDYLCSKTYSAEQVRINVVTTQHWTSIDPKALIELLFGAGSLELLARANNG